jgi:hypothetical protein
MLRNQCPRLLERWSIRRDVENGTVDTLIRQILILASMAQIALCIKRSPSVFAIVEKMAIPGCSITFLKLKNILQVALFLVLQEGVEITRRRDVDVILARRVFVLRGEWVKSGRPGMRHIIDIQLNVRFFALYRNPSLRCFWYTKAAVVHPVMRKKPTQIFLWKVRIDNLTLSFHSGCHSLITCDCSERKSRHENLLTAMRPKRSGEAYTCIQGKDFKMQCK